MCSILSSNSSVRACDAHMYVVSCSLYTWLQVLIIILVPPWMGLVQIILACLYVQ
jgi:hypothetical protein